VLGAGKQIVDTYVAGGQVKVIFWPITDFGQTSIDAAASAYCVGQQDVNAYWRFHDRLFEQYAETYGGDRDYFVNAAGAAGADQAAFEACYDGGEGHAIVTNLNQIRLDMGINRRPTFDVNGNLLFGAPPFATFDQLIQASLP
jgi:protein-disulfide isomerase